MSITPVGHPAKHLVLDASCINSLYLPLGFIANLPSTLNVTLAVEVKNTIFNVCTNVVEEEISEFILINHHPPLQDDILQGISMWPSFRFNSRLIQKKDKLKREN
ncbi:hypothetical protein IV203_031085 [Nitzschia inconspicua]|uniref:Uncharacterized protein n=1 Tax=Nitzschia inconspicua TaxID=303405 RepID=A0A9K3LU91_9STRA|nr:hypothetical protein IV203_031085 [Nitzschia inconspicua]